MGNAHVCERMEQLGHTEQCPVGEIKTTEDIIRVPSMYSLNFNQQVEVFCCLHPDHDIARQIYGVKV